jgi:hypothetical protein
LAVRRYLATFTVTVDLTIHRDDIMDRVLENQDGWRDHFYNLDEEEVVEMLARCCGIYGESISNLEGWGDCDSSDVTTSEEIDLEEVVPYTGGPA